MKKRPRKTTPRKAAPNKASRRGPKLKIQEPEAEKIYLLLKAGNSLADAADLLGMDRRTIQNRKKADPKFFAGVMQATALGKKRLVEKLFKSKSWQAQAWVLERRWGAEYGKKVDVTSRGKSIVLRDETERPDRDIVAEAALGAVEGSAGSGEV